jgi:hypothetical protein
MAAITKKIEISLNGKTTGLEFKCQIENQASYYRLLNITGVLGEFKQEEIRTHTYTHPYIWGKSYCLKIVIVYTIT